MQPVDLHIHTHLSPDGKGRMQEFYNRAKEEELALICFTDHLDFEYGWDPVGLNAVIAHGKSEYQELETASDTKALFGVELAYQEEFEGEAKESIDSLKPDFVVGSVHEIDGLGFSGRNVSKYFDKFGRNSFSKYFDVLSAFAEKGIFDVVGHFDIVKRNSKKCGYEFKTAEYKSIIRDILKAIISRNKGIEVNTSGMRQLPKNLSPICRWLSGF